MSDQQNLRKQIEEHLAREEWFAARDTLTVLWRQQPAPATANFVIGRFDNLRARISMTPCRLAILRSFTVEPLVPLLRAGAFTGGIDLTVEVGDFNAYAQEIFNPDSRLYRLSPDVAILAIQTRDIAPELWDSFASLSADDIQAEINRVVANFNDWIQAFRSHSQAHLIVHGLETPLFPAQGALDSQTALGQTAAIQTINRELQRLAGEQRGVYFLDYDAVIARFGRSRWHDERRWLTMRLPMTVDAFIELTGEWLRFLHPLAGKVCKVLVTDLDNTLWGGVIGEDGMEGIKLGAEYPGADFQSLQRAMLDLYHRGVILAVNSKNNEADAMAAIETHPGMILRPRHFAAMRINWQDKAQNIREIAAELNIGLDAIAFMDDNPAECSRVRQELPEVTIIELPKDSKDHAPTLRNCAVFERLALSAEDRERGRHYAEQRQRIELQTRATSIEDYYRSLEQQIEIEPVTPMTMARAAQLTQKTNQFNLTTRRYSEQRIAEMSRSNEWRVYTARVQDRFGDHGLVSIMIAKAGRDVWEIDTFLLSCRVIGRTVETALLSFLAREAHDNGARQLQGWFLPTKKNAPASSFYADHGFQIIEENSDGKLYSLRLRQSQLAYPEWIEMQVNNRMDKELLQREQLNV
ncbi:MAG: HAD-IIIC family phosphatase [Acidobacteriota bacterium]